MALLMWFWKDARSNARSNGKVKVSAEEIVFCYCEGMVQRSQFSVFDLVLEATWIMHSSFSGPQMGLFWWCCSGQYTLTSIPTPGPGEFVMGEKMA